jgi:peroxiredoxin (alkyl hydroperoxide reductase subunit C)
MSLVQKQAPDFTAKAVMQNGEVKQIKLSEFRDKYVVLFFYPFDFTFVCPTEILSFSNHIKDFESKKVQVLGCSIDSHHVHRAWRNTKVEEGGIGNIAYPLVADVNKTIARDFGVLLDGGMALRGTFLIDRGGIVRHETINDLDIGRNIEETLRVVDALQHSEEHGEVCPAGWNKGKTAMKGNPQSTAQYLKENASKL